MEPTQRDRVRAGDPVAFASLYDECAPVVYRHAARVCGDRAQAEDVVSLTFLEAWRLRERLRPDDGALLPWVMGIATNVLRNTRRAGRRHRAALARLPAPAVEPDFAGDVAARLDDRDRLRAARHALARLRRADREVFTLFVWAGLDYAAVATALGIPVGTVRSRLSRARATLRRLVDPDREPAAPGGQVPGDRVIAARSGRQEEHR